MGKQGPCYHCGVTRTPLWRNGPPEKPVLCNACGSRWRTKGTLAKYTPLHARPEPEESRARVKSISINKNKVKLLKRKPNHDTAIISPDYNLGFRKFVDEDTSNRSSSGSAISNSESCAQFGSVDASDLTGPAQSNVWDSMVSSKKRTCVNRPKPSPVEKLTKDLYTILHEQRQSSYFSGSFEEDLLLESETPMVSIEIGHGSILIRHPSSIAREEESEVSSLSFDNKQYSMNEAYSHLLNFPAYNDRKSINFLGHGIEKAKNPAGQGMLHEQVKRDKAPYEKTLMLESHNSPLCNIDLSDIINIEEFVKHLTKDEQQQLLRYLPPLDISKLPESLKCMFESPQFKDNLCYFQQLLEEGFFDISVSGVKAEDCKTLKRFALFNLTKSHWVEFRHGLKKCKSSVGGSVVARGPNAITLNNSVAMKRSRNSQIPDERTLKSPKRVTVKATYGNKEHRENDDSCFCPRSLFALPPDGSSLMLDSLHFVDECSDQDLLLDVPHNGSFPQAELLHPTSSLGQRASTSSNSLHPHLVHPY
ncbi:GATA transcription factor 26 [Hibiscus syriacus]|uniref:GATA transcription factor 26 n=1 Tax=Hibiscus syriacus TaxID=106335 RepID=A0A6A3BE14_HIBSY|nr:GATA transcription factor 26-like [Hibiscus syriacus]KAE8713788.1 GATA transcription factor 26 [Hibiscus syriacus]